MFCWNVSSAQDIGGRRIQEDGAVVFLSADRTTALGVVADGLGGHGGGDIASGIVIDAARELWKVLPDRKEDGSALLDELISTANERILDQHARCRNEARTTFCGTLIRDGEVDITSVGDSRAYRLGADNPIERLTRDHSVTEMLLATGEITEDAMRTHPDASRLTQSLGSDNRLTPFRIRRQKAKPGDMLLLCSDGLWQSFPRPDLGLALKRLTVLGVKELVEEARAIAGDGSDNVSAVVLQADTLEPAQSRSVLGRSIRRWLHMRDGQ
ncbi:PP2C family protein-serine/threonine phosphatase [Rhizobium leguminosarum]|uniref:PP2C family protein-serine/threonine phosphatase n=1 Tax=Rhizobium leguminosarum TaxID=384 RepID=UPI0024B3C5BA|nr:protein phosphatase 2C domain-containing protein [Rhizobium leguminosarum]WHO82575.1 protein phosphatase 2C domain-containing protein [Rhizobium leguminosarum]